MPRKPNSFGMSMTKATADFVFVHGFLGMPTDWLDIQSVLRLNHRQSFYSVNLWEHVQKGVTFESLAQFIAERCHENSLVVGYSLGGRLLMHLPPETLQKLSAMVLISSHFGLEDEAEKQARLKNDSAWAERFRTEKWSTLMASWNTQPIFKKDIDRPERFEHNYSRQQLADVMIATSLANQSNQLARPHLPFRKLLYIYGQDDAKYAELAKKWKTKQPEMTVKSVAGGHYPLVNSAVEVANHVSSFYRNLMIPS